MQHCVGEQSKQSVRGGEWMRRKVLDFILIHTHPPTQRYTHIHLHRDTHTSTCTEIHTHPPAQRYTHIHLHRYTHIHLHRETHTSTQHSSSLPCTPTHSPTHPNAHIHYPHTNTYIHWSTYTHKHTQRAYNNTQKQTNTYTQCFSPPRDDQQSLPSPPPHTTTHHHNLTPQNTHYIVDNTLLTLSTPRLAM